MTDTACLTEMRASTGTCPSPACKHKPCQAGKSQRRPTPRPSDGVWAEMVVQDSGCKSNKSSALASPPATRANLNIPSLDESREPAIGKVVCSSPRGKVMVLGLPSPRVPIDNFMTLSSVPELDEECSDDDE